MRHSKLFILFIGCIFISLFITGCDKNSQLKENAPIVKTMVVGMSDKNDSSVYAGEVKGRYESQLAFQVGGKIITRNIDLGTRVSKGDLLMAIDAKDVVQTANIGAAQVESARAQLALAEANLARYRQLYEQAAISLAQYEQYKTTYESALATLKQAQAQAAQGSNALEYSQLLADADGVIAAIQGEVGQVVAAGQSMVTLVKDGELEVEINIPESRIKDVKVGESAAISFWALNNVVVNGTIREISPIADPVARTYKVRITLLNSPDTISLGMTASARLNNVDTDLNYYVVLLSAIYQTDDHPKVWIVKDNQVKLQAVVIENFADNAVKVTGGLHAGDVIVTAGVHKLHEGQEVRLAGEPK